MEKKKVISKGKFGQRPAARPVNPVKKQQLEAKREQLRAKQAAVTAKRTSAPRAVTATAASALGEETVTRLNSLQTEFDGLHDDIMLVSVHDEMGEVESILVTLATDLAELRVQGYAFRSFLENKISVLTDKWEALCDEVDADVDRQSAALSADADEAERALRQAMGGNRVMVSRAESAVKSLASKSNSARSAVQNRYREVAQTIRQTRQQLDQIQWLFQQAEEAKFDFLESECLVTASKAKLVDSPEDKEGEQGILFLSDERLIFEQKEKVATKKVLFFTTASEMVQEVRLAALLGWIEKVDALDTRKFLSSKELLSLQFSREAERETALFELQEGAKNEEWVQAINRIRSGEIEKERVASAAEEKAAAAEQVANAPTICPTCGASLSATVARGQSTINCDYCGAVIRL